MLWEAYQQRKIAGAEQTADKAKSKADRFAGDISRLRKRVDRLTLACQSMWELIRDNTEFTEKDLEEKMLEVDLRDGKADGKIGAEIAKCPECGSNTNSKRNNCLMCGTPLSKTHNFEG